MLYISVINIHIKKFPARSEKFNRWNVQSKRFGDHSSAGQSLTSLMWSVFFLASPLVRTWRLHAVAASGTCTSQRPPFCFSALLFYSRCFLWLVPDPFLPGHLFLPLQASTLLLSLLTPQVGYS